MSEAGQGELQPGGVVALLFTDVVGSTRMLDRLGDDAHEQLRRIHFSLLRQAVKATGGQEVKSLGDGLMVAFTRPAAALQCAVEMQRTIAAHNSQKPNEAVEIRVGLHLGDPPRDEDDFFGMPVVIARRLCDRAAGGQILSSELLTDVAGRGGGNRFRRLGRLQLKGLAEPVAAVAVEWEEAPTTGSPSPLRRASHAPAARGPRLVGRDEELDVLRAELARASEGEFRSVLVLGDAGMGKTRLAAELLAESSSETLTLTGRAYPFGQTTTFGLWTEALERYLRRLAVHEIVDLCGGFLDDLAELLRSVAAARGAAPEGQAPLLRLMDGLAALLANLAARGPVVISFDDIHLADASSWKALHYLAHTLSDTPVLVVASARPAELTEHPSAGVVVAGLEQDGQLRRLTLHPVGRAALAELCQGVIQVPAPEPLVHWVAERSGGNPLFALGLVGALVDEGGDLSAPRLRRLPETLADRVAGRLDDLDSAGLATAEALAVLARPLSLDELSTLTDRSLDETAGIVHRLIRSRFVTVDEGDSETRYDLTHPLLQEVIYDRTGPTRRRALHRLAAQSLLASGRVGEAAPHFARGAEVGDPEAVDALREAFREAEERRAHLEALEVLVILVELLPAQDQRWLGVAGALLPEAYAMTDHRVEAGGARGLAAMRFLESVLEHSPDLARRAAVKYRLARLVGWGVGHPSEAIGLARSARDLYEAAGDRRSAVVATGGLAHLCSIAGDFAAMDAEAERALRGAEALGEPGLAANALAAQYRTAGLQSRFDDFEAIGERLIALGRAEGYSENLAWILTVTAAGRAFAGRVREAVPILAEVKSLSPTSGRSILLSWEIGIQWLAGDIARAMECVDRFTTAHPEIFWRFVGAGFAAMAAVEADRPAEAKDHLARAQQSFGATGWSYFGYFVDHAAAVVAWQSKDEERALALLGGAAATLMERGGVGFAALALLDQAEVAADIGAQADAAEAAQRLGQIATAVDRDLYRGFAAFGRACAALGGDPGGAVESAEEAATMASSLGYKLIEGRALLLVGRARAAFDRSGARAALEQAITTFDDCGAIWRRDRARALLRGMGSRGRKAAAARLGPSALTRREREVAQLAAKGHTARQIADTLFVGERTVEGHLASVYTKLGIASRVELARQADELGL